MDFYGNGIAIILRSLEGGNRSFSEYVGLIGPENIKLDSEHRGNEVKILNSADTGSLVRRKALRVPLPKLAAPTR